MPIENITFNGVTIQAASGFTCTNAQGIRFTDTTITTAQGPALIVNNSHNISSAGLNQSP